MSLTEMVSRLKQAVALVESVRDAINPDDAPIHRLPDETAATVNSLNGAILCLHWAAGDLDAPCPTAGQAIRDMRMAEYGR